MNDMLASECSSGCESGWTFYLEHSLLSSHGNNEFVDGRGIYSEEKRVSKVVDEEEDLSMVSDASSGPPLLRDDEYCGSAENGWFCHSSIDAALPKNSGKGKKNKGNRRRKVEEHPSILDDTASSAIFNFSQDNFTLANNPTSMENILSQGSSATHFEGGSAFHEPFGFFQSSLSGNQLQQNQWFGGKMG